VLRRDPVTQDGPAVLVVDPIKPDHPDGLLLDADEEPDTVVARDRVPEPLRLLRPGQWTRVDDDRSHPLVVDGLVEEVDVGPPRSSGG
jgi:hypothetical protein